MERQQRERILTKNNQPIKEITSQDICLLNDTFDQIQSWTKALSLLNDFFSNRAIPLNKKKIIKEFHANAHVFNAFYQDFLDRTTTLENQIEELKKRPQV